MEEKVTFRCSEELREWLKEQADHDERKVGAWIRMFLEAAKVRAEKRKR